MDSLKVTALILVLVITGCKESVEIEQKKWTDPFSGSSQIMEQVQLEPWKVLTFPENRDALILIQKENGPMFSYDSTGDYQTIMAHPKDKSGHSSVDIIDSNNDGVFDKIRFFSGPTAERFTMYEANLENDVWVINEHTNN